MIGSSVGGLIGGYDYEFFVKQRGEPQVLWLLFAKIGVATIFWLLLFNRLVSEKPNQQKQL